MSSDILKVDIYELLNISPTADEKEIKSAYRKKALSCHPDKNPDNPKAAELFQQLTKALEILTDIKAKAAYDLVLRAKKAAQVRNGVLDSKRKKLKEDLEAREKAALDEKLAHVDAAKNLQQEIERLRKEGSKQVEAEQELLRQQIFQEREHSGNASDFENALPRLKVKWTVQKGNADEYKYSEAELKLILGKHGHITCLVVSNKKKGSAIVEYSELEAAKSAFELETGRSDNPLKLSWIGGQPSVENGNSPEKQNITIPAPTFAKSCSTVTSRDYESLVLMKLRQAEERKRLIQQMKDEDG